MGFFPSISILFTLANQHSAMLVLLLLAERSTLLQRYGTLSQTWNLLYQQPPLSRPASQQPETADNAYLWIRSMEVQIGERYNTSGRRDWPAKIRVTGHLLPADVCWAASANRQSMAW